MAGFSLDFDNTLQGEVKDGTYEVIIDHATEDATKNGAEFINFQMTIRNDIDQPHKNQKIWDRIFKAKKDNKYPAIMINTMGKAASLENGKTYSSLEDLLEDFRGKPLQVTVKNETSEYNGQTYENLNVKDRKQTKFPNIQHQFKESDENNGQAQQSNDNPFDNTSMPEGDLPF